MRFSGIDSGRVEAMSPCACEHMQVCASTQQWGSWGGEGAALRLDAV